MRRVAETAWGVVQTPAPSTAGINDYLLRCTPDPEAALPETCEGVLELAREVDGQLETLSSATCVSVRRGVDERLQRPGP